MVTSPRRSSEVSVAIARAGAPEWMKNRAPEITGAPAKGSLKARRKAVGWDQDYRHLLISQSAQ